MNKIILIALLSLSTLTANAWVSFTNDVYQVIDQPTQLPMTIGTTADESLLIDPIEIWFTFGRGYEGLEGEVKHLGISYEMPDQIADSMSPVVVGPVNEFFGTRLSGTWKFNIDNVESPFYLKQWGFTIVPEPSSFALMGLGGIALLVFRKQFKS